MCQPHRKLFSTGLAVRGRHGKWILRKWLERHCPAAEPWARKKGFTVPVEAWIAPRARA